MHPGARLPDVRRGYVKLEPLAFQEVLALNSGATHETQGYIGRQMLPLDWCINATLPRPLHSGQISQSSFNFLPQPPNTLQNNVIALAMSDTSSEPYDPPMEPLHGESNFYIWKSVILLHLGYLRLKKIVLGTVPRPPTPASSSSSSAPPSETHEQRKWDLNSAQAIIFIHNRVEPSLQGLISFSSTAPEVWKTLMQIYHRSEPTILMRSLGAITHMRLDDNESIAEHLEAFGKAWFDLRMRTADAPPVVEGVQSSLETALKVLAGSELCEAEVLINSLPMDTWMIGWDLRDRHGADLRTWHVSRKLMDIHEKRERKRKVAEEAAAAAAAAAEDCTWCRSRGYESAGHRWKECRRLRKFKAQKEPNTRGRRT